MSNPITIKITIDLEQMKEFHKGIPNIGTFENPFNADAFYSIYTSEELLTGLQNNILLVRDDCMYTWLLVSNKGTELSFDFSGTEDKEPTMEFTMLNNDASTSKPTKEKWDKVFKDDSDKQKVNDKGKLELKCKKSGSNVFSLDTATKVDRANNLTYTISFMFEEDGKVYYGLIDPNIKTVPPPPPPPE